LDTRAVLARNLVAYKLSEGVIGKHPYNTAVG